MTAAVGQQEELLRKKGDDVYLPCQNVQTCDQIQWVVQSSMESPAGADSTSGAWFHFEQQKDAPGGLHSGSVGGASAGCWLLHVHPDGAGSGPDLSGCPHK